MSAAAKKESATEQRHHGNDVESGPSGSARRAPLQDERDGGALQSDGREARAGRQSEQLVARTTRLGLPPRWCSRSASWSKRAERARVGILRRSAVCARGASWYASDGESCFLVGSLPQIERVADRFDTASLAKALRGPLIPASSRIVRFVSSLHAPRAQCPLVRGIKQT